MVVSAVTPGFIVVVVSVPVPVVVCGVSQEAIASDITARNKMLFISSVFVEKKYVSTFPSNNYARLGKHQYARFRFVFFNSSSIAFFRFS